MKKKDLENGVEEAAEESSTEETTEAEQDEAVELEASEAPEEEAVAEPVKKPRRRRQSRKKAAAATPAHPLAGMAQGDSEAPAEDTRAVASVAEVPSFEATPVTPSYIREDAAVAEVSIHKSMDSMVKQWAAVKEISNSVCTNLERVAATLQTLQTGYSNATQELQRPLTTKPAAPNRLTIGFSIAAIVFSTLSLTLSNATRQAALSAVQSSAPLAFNGPAASGSETASPANTINHRPLKDLALVKDAEATALRRDRHKEVIKFQPTKHLKK